MATGVTGGDPSKLSKAGGVLTGPLTLPGPPTAPLHAATKQYVDSRAGGGGGGAAPITRRAIVETGDVTLANSGGLWVPLPGFELQLPAAVGDEVELSAAFMSKPNGEDQIDWAVLVGAGPAIVRRASTGTAAPTTSPEGGDPSMYQTIEGFRSYAGPFGFTVTDGDLDGGVVRFAMIAHGNGGTKIFASENYPFRWRARNDGPGAP